MLPFYEVRNKQMQASVGTGFPFPPHLHQEIELLLVFEGEMEATIGSKPYRIQEGQLCVIFPNTVHSYRCLKEDTRQAMLICRSEFRSDLKSITERKIPVRPVIRHPHEDILSMVEKLTSPQIEQEPTIVIDAYFELLLARVLTSLELQDNKVDHSDNLSARLIAYLTEHFTDKISLDSLSRTFGVSRYKISRIFSATIGMSFSHYLNTLRVDQAKGMLHNPEFDILTIAFECGFESQQTFNRVFKEQCGLTPREFRKTVSTVR